MLDYGCTDIESHTTYSQLMLTPGTGIPVKEVKIKTSGEQEIKRCFSGLLHEFIVALFLFRVTWYY